jgi:hypothetical protein
MADYSSYAQESVSSGIKSAQDGDLQSKATEKAAQVKSMLGGIGSSLFGQVQSLKQ